MQKQMSSPTLPRKTSRPAMSSPLTSVGSRRSIDGSSRSPTSPPGTAGKQPTSPRSPGVSAMTIFEDSESAKRPLTWTCLESSRMPEKRHGHSLVTCGFKHFLFGGLTSIVPTNDLWSLELAGSLALWNRVEFPEGAPMPSRRTGHSAAVVGSKMYIFGGDNLQTCLDDFWAYDVETNSWDLVRSIGAAPLPRYGHSMVVVGTTILLFGGANRHYRNPDQPGKSEIVFYNDIWRFETETGVWEQVLSTPTAVIPAKRYGHSFTVVGDLVYMYGGFYTEGLTSIRMCDLWELNPTTFKWREITPTSGVAAPKLMQHTAVAVTDQLLVYGGVSSGAIPSSNIYVFDTRTYTWNVGNTTFPPPSRSLHTTIVRGNDMIVYGGVSEGRSLLNDTWSLSVDVLVRPPSKLQQMLLMIEALFTQMMALRMSLRTDKGDALMHTRTQFPLVRWEQAALDAVGLQASNVTFIESVMSVLGDRLSAQTRELLASQGDEVEAQLAQARSHAVAEIAAARAETARLGQDMREALRKSEEEMNRRMKAADERVIALADSTQRRVADLERRFDASLRDAAAALGSRINDVDARVSDSNVAAAKETARVDAALADAAQKQRAENAALFADTHARMRASDDVTAARARDLADQLRSTRAALEESEARQRGETAASAAKVLGVAEAAAQSAAKVDARLTAETGRLESSLIVLISRHDAEHRDAATQLQTRIDALDRALHDAAAALPALDAHLAQMRAELAQGVLAAQKHADGVRDDVLVRFDEMTRVAQTLSRLPADLAALNSRLTEVDARFPKDQLATHVSAREALGAQLSARIDAAEAASERRARETADTAAAASALAVTRADAVEKESRARAAGSDIELRRRADDLADQLARLQTQVDGRLRAQDEGVGARLTELEARVAAAAAASQTAQARLEAAAVEKTEALRREHAARLALLEASGRGIAASEP